MGKARKTLEQIEVAELKKKNKKIVTLKKLGELVHRELTVYFKALSALAQLLK